MGSTASAAGPAITQVVDASAALATLQQIERNAQTIGNDAAGLLGGLQSALQSVRRGPLHPGERGLIGHESLLDLAPACSPALGTVLTSAGTNRKHRSCPTTRWIT
jgi:predicted hotdog family 3-hydroxylacyl-ACP dehydratase